MGKIVRFFFLLLFLISSLISGNLREEIEGNLSKIPYSSKKELIRANNALKNLYIKAIISEDEYLQKKALEGIIKSSKILHFSYDRYQKAYEKLTGKKFESVKAKDKKSSNNLKFKTSKIRNISFDKYSLTIRFDRVLRKDDFRIYNLNSKNRFIKVIDLKSNLFFIPPKVKLKGVDRVRIAQNRKNLVRIVFEKKSPFKIDSKTVGDKLILTLNQNHKSFSKSKNIKKTVNRQSTISPIVKVKRVNSYYKNRVIVIDPGHGGKDSGAIGYQHREEKKAVLEIAKKVAKELKRRGFKVYLTRDRDIFIPLRDRTKFANKKMADIFISIHANAAPGKSSYLSMKGVETYFLSPARSSRAKNVAALENQSDMVAMDYFSKEIFLNFYNRERIIASNKLAIDVQAGILKNLRKRYKVVDGGVREGPFWVLVGAQMPSILIEVGYITNPTDAKRLFNPFFQNILAKGIADGVESYFLKNR